MRGLPFLLPIALLAGCLGAQHEVRSAPAVRPGYECSVGQQLEPGASVVVRLEADGRPIDAHMDWRPPHGDIWQPRAIVLWLAPGSADLRAGDGAVFISWSRQEDARRRGRRPRLRLELTTEVRPRHWPEAPIAGDFEDGGSGYGLRGNLADFVAFARGAPSLFAVLRDRRGVAVSQTAFDGGLFIRAAAEADAALAELRPILADYRARCQYTDDIDPQVVLT